MAASATTEPLALKWYQKSAMGVSLRDEASQRGCFQCYMMHQIMRERDHARISAKMAESENQPVSLPSNIMLLPKAKPAPPLHSTLEGARRVALLAARKKKTAKKHETCAKVASSPLSPIAEDPAGDGSAWRRSLGELHVCAHLCNYAIVGKHSVYIKAAEQALERCELFRLDSRLVLLAWLERETERQARKPKKGPRPNGNC